MPSLRDVGQHSEDILNMIISSTLLDHLTYGLKISLILLKHKYQKVNEE